MITSKKSGLSAGKLRQKFLDFFKNRRHKVVPSSSLLPPSGDASVLFTTAGMQQFSLYLSGEKDVLEDFGTRHLISCQKCFRSDDIEEVGDDTHNTFFEMLGNWSIGQDKDGNYFKEGAIKYALEFFVDELGLDKNRFYITIFRGNKDISRDEESEKIWLENGIPKERIKEFGEKDNLWGPVGEIGVCGPNSEIHYDRGEEFGCGRKDCGPNCSKCQRFVELWNLVFMQYHRRIKNQKSKIKTSQEPLYEYVALPQKNVDTGIGFERLLAVLQGKSSAYETDLFWPVIQEIEKISSKKYNEEKKIFRILADHLRGAAFLISEGVLPSNLTQGYVLRRILRRSIRYAKVLNLPKDWYVSPVKKISEIYGEVYSQVRTKETDIITVIQKEEEKFAKTLEKGLKEFKVQSSKFKVQNQNLKPKTIPGEIVFDLYQSYGFPLEMTKELAEEENLKIDESGFLKEFKKHQEISRAGAEKKFKGGLADVRKETIKLHTAAHLLLESLRRVLGNHVYQKGSNINAERLRFDFSHPDKLTDEEKQKVEDLVNEQIQKNLPVSFKEMTLEDAKRIGAMGVFEAKYGKKVKVYTIGKGDNVFSREICGGPHVKNTSELGKFKIKKEQSSGAGVRRIKAVLDS